MTILITKNHLRIKKEVENIVCRTYEVSPTALHSRLRDQKTSRARFIAFYILREYHKLPLATIGKLWDRHHSSIDNGIRKIVDLNLKKEVEDLMLSTYSRT